MGVIASQRRSGSPPKLKPAEARRSSPKYQLDIEAERPHENVRQIALTVREFGALTDLYNVAVRIADVATSLAVLGYWLRDELGASTFPQFIARLDICNAE